MGEKLGFYLGENWDLLGKKSFGNSALCTGRDLLGLVGLVCKKKWGKTGIFWGTASDMVALSTGRDLLDLVGLV